jgi:YfiH family protein
MPENINIIAANWPAPANVKAYFTTRNGGSSVAPYDSFNLALHVGDNPIDVKKNRQQLVNQLPDIHNITWLDQCHSTIVVAAENFCDQSITADASFTQEKNLACVVMTADCLPVLFCDKNGTQIASAHAGWRGLADGILENTVAEFRGPTSDIMAWFGPAISGAAFEVGDDVRDEFLQASENPSEEALAFHDNPNNPQHYFADIYQLARLRLQRLGITDIYGGTDDDGKVFCTYTDAQQFFSYRRDDVTGRIASLIYLNDA